VAVLGNDATFSQQHAGQHNFLANDELPLQHWVQFFERDGMPRDVLQWSLNGRVFADGTLRPRAGLRVLLLFRSRFLAGRFLASRRFAFCFYWHSIVPWIFRKVYNVD
jgi:hypothetical protein